MWSNIGEICQREVVTVRPSDEVVEAARQMREHHVGYLIVTEPDAAARLRPVGVITDRDIVVTVIAKEVDPRTLTVGDVMTADPVVVREDASVAAALAEMRKMGVRRMPIVDDGGLLLGVVSIDDVLETLAEGLGDIAGSIRHEQRLERAFRT